MHPDFRSHTSAVLTYGEGALQTLSTKQKLNTRSSCESKLVGVDDAATKILWTKQFMEAQGYRIDRNVLYQDNKSTILLLENGKQSAGKRSRALNIRYFFIHDQKEKGNIDVEYCPTMSLLLILAQLWTQIEVIFGAIDMKTGKEKSAHTEENVIK